ncbi:N-acetylneuraminate synthase [Geomonas azotofigens]|uniref:N-acetylneuraminate synthase n=1 Tax=Geomonas azotofigens TaxID=2843196 RepID=UPI001C0F63D1|nr:N-acetylneuraminate synthase [Geomonas azotofigens]MBU5615221.1 N-acetylneuraminate synthase [Geomonas azotofigens]
MNTTATKRVYVIAEAGVNHNGSLDMAKELVQVAAQAGADAVKFQTFRAERLVSGTAPKADYQKKASDANESQYAMLKRLELGEEAHGELIRHCQLHGIQFLSTPFDAESVDLLGRTLDLPTLKIPSGEVTNAPLLLKIASLQKPVIMSTGMCTLADVEAALGVLAFGYTCPQNDPGITSFQEAYASDAGQQALREKVTLLHCTTEYPAPFAEVNLRAMDTLASAFGLPVGFSDHTEGIAMPVAAVARGAVIIEKHFTLDRALPGPDHKASLEPEELSQMVQAIRQVEVALGSGTKVPAPSEVKNAAIARKSIVAAADIPAGEPFSVDNLCIKRPGGGLSPLRYWEVVGRRADRNYVKDEVIEL